LYDVSHDVNDFKQGSNKLQGQQKLTSDMCGTARAFEMKLKLFWKQLENVNLCHFSSCDLLHKDGSVSVPFLNVVVDVINFMAENFKMRFSGFCSHGTYVHVFENPFSVHVGRDALEILQFELIEMQYD
jgi:hypothetical protein